jgi:glycosyltransferase involved in cell wall biosynthesis
MKFSFVIPVYSSPFLYELFDSLLIQKYSNWEAIFVDDGSNDEGKTVRILNDIYNKDHRVKLIFQENQGIGGAVNNGLKYTTGDYVMILGHDDCISTELLLNVYQTAINTNADIISPNVEMFFNDVDYKFNWNEKNKIEIGNIISGKEAFTRTFPWEVHGWNFYRGIIIRNTLFPMFTTYNADEYAYRELMLKSRTVAFTDGYYMYRFVPNSVTNHISLRYFDVFETHSALYELALEHNINNDCIQNILYHFYLDLIDRIKLLCYNNYSFEKEATNLTKTGYLKFKKTSLSYNRYNNVIHFFLLYYTNFVTITVIYRIWHFVKRKFV